MQELLLRFIPDVFRVYDNTIRVENNRIDQCSSFRNLICSTRLFANLR